MPEIMGGQTSWSGGRDEEGHRTYKLGIQTFGSPLDGPAAHLQTPGLPLPGSVWAYDNDLDVYAWCTGAVDLRPRQGQGFANIFYDHSYTFTTRPRGSRHGRKDDRGQKKRCADITIQDPLAEPPKRSGGFIRNSEEYRYNANGKRLKVTSTEPMTGPSVEFDRSRSQVTIEFNDPNLNYETYTRLKDTVNEDELWDLPARCWKLCEWHWECKLYGTCFFYYTHRLVFESNTNVAKQTMTVVDLDTEVAELINPEQIYSCWDHYVPDESSLCLKGNWDDRTKINPRWVLAGGVDYRDPNSYEPIRAPRGGGNIRRVLSRTRRGAPADNENDELIWVVKVYREADFLSEIPSLPATL